MYWNRLKFEKKINKYILKIDKVNKKNKKITKKNRKKIENKNYNKNDNIINDFHWKTINYLITNYDTILIGNLSTKQIVGL